MLGDQGIAAGIFTRGFRECMLIRELPLLKLRNIFKNSPIAKERGLHSSWCTNEKTAMEVHWVFLM